MQIEKKMPDTLLPITAGGLDRETKQEIRKWVLRLRHLLQDDFEKQLKRYGFEAGKPLKQAPEYLNGAEKQAHGVIAATIRRDAQNERTNDAALDAYIRECAFTLLNRLVGLKCMETRGILTIGGEANEAITERPEYGDRPRLLWQMRETDRKYRQDETLLWHDGLIAAFRAVTADIAVLFDPDSAWSQLWPTQKILMEAVRAINGLDAVCKREGLPSVYASPDFLGWVYQFFNVEEKEQIRADTGGKPRTSHELAVINQFYTPDWIVKFLVDNTLGRVWLRMHPETRLRSRLSYLVPNTGEEEPAPLKPVRDLKLLDPACGTMHMGQYAFGLLYEMYLEEHEKAGSEYWPAVSSVSSETEIPAAILANNLFGIDIDARAIQIAALTLLLTMKEQARAHGLDPQTVRVHHINLVCADAVNLGEAQMNEFFSELDPFVFGGDAPMRRAVKAVWEGLQHVAELGSLVQVGEEVERALQETIPWRLRLFEPSQENFAEALEMDAPQRMLTAEERKTAREQLEAALADYASRHTGANDINQRLFAQETGKALTLLDILRHKYDAIVMNPPYGDPTDAAKRVLKKQNANNYTDNYSMFVGRSVSLLKPSIGYVGALTSRTFLYLSSFTYLRSNFMVGANKISTLLDLGIGVLDGATVETAAYIIGNHSHSKQAIFFRLDDIQDKKLGFEEALYGCRNDVTYSRPMSFFQSLPDCMLGYSMPQPLAHAFQKYATCQTMLAQMKQGMATGDDDRFLRNRWEIQGNIVLPTSTWKLFAKGGEYAPYYRDFELLVNWKDDGAEIKASDKSRYGRGSTFYFTEGYTWPSSNSIGLNVQWWPGGVFSIKGMAGFPYTSSNKWMCLGFLNSHLAGTFAKVINPGRDYQVGHLNRIPLPSCSSSWSENIGILAKELYDHKRSWDEGNEIAACFVMPWLVQVMQRCPEWQTLNELLDECLEWEAADSAECQRLQGKIDATVYDLYEITSDDRALIERELGTRPMETVWPQMEGKTKEQKRVEHVCRLLSWLVKTIVETDPDGIVPLVPSAGKPSLVEQVRKGLEDVFGVERAPGIESEINALLPGRATLETWLQKSWFKYHISLYKRRPIYWHITDGEENGFGAIVHYHRFTHDRLLQLRSAYLYDDYIQRLQSEMSRLKSDLSQEGRARQSELERLLDSARALDEKLRQIQEGEIAIQVPWKAQEAQPKGWRPDIDDGVKVNIGPFEQAGVLTVKKVV